MGKKCISFSKLLRRNGFHANFGQKYEIYVLLCRKISEKRIPVDLALFIARRTARSGPGSNAGVMERIAVISVALSIAVMLLSVAVMMGFKREVARKMAGITGHVVLSDLRGSLALDATPLRRTPHLEELMADIPGFRSAAPYALKGGIVRTDETVEGITLKGVDASYPWQTYRAWLTEGELPRIGDTVRTKEILLSRNLARRLQAAVGDKIEMLFVERDELPRRDRFKVSGIYASGMDEMDNLLVLTDLRNVQRLARWSADEVSGYEILLDDPEHAGRYADELDELLFLDEADETLNLAALSVQQRYPNVFDWLKAHDVNTAVILAIMLAVSFFNMATALLILVLGQVRTIGLLKAFGMRNTTLRRIFLYRAAFVALRGLAWGNLIGVGCCLLQASFHLVRLNPEGYLLSEMPVALSFGHWALLNAGFLAAIVALLLLPASIVATVKPSEAIRYE